MAVDNVFSLPDPLAGQSSSGADWSAWAKQVDPLKERYAAASGWMPGQQYDYTAQTSPGVEFDPLPRGEMFDTTSQLFGAQQVNASLDQWNQLAHPELYNFVDPATSSNAGQLSSPGGEWAQVDKWDQQVVSAVKQVAKDTGVYVPLNLVKSVMRLESGGFMVDDPGGAKGLMQVMPFWGPDLGLDLNDPAQNIMAGVKILALNFLEGDPSAPGDESKRSWEWAAKRYLGLGGPDSYGTTADTYWQRVNQYWTDLAGQGGTGGGAAKPNTKTFKAIWGGIDAPITQGYGYEDCTPNDFCFARDSDYAKSAYAYTSGYSTNGQLLGHMGVDVGVSYGTPLYSPGAGTVVIAGGTPYYNNHDPQGNPITGPQMGELAIEYDNGDQVILGHMSQITRHVGDRVQQGEFVGYSGNENGDHVHVEYRKKTTICTNGFDGICTTQGFVAVDPRDAISGMFTGVYGQPGSGPIQPAGANDWHTFMRYASQGLPITGAATVGGFHDWLRQQMGVGTAPIATSPVNTDPNRWLWGQEDPIPGGGGSHPTP